MEQLAAAIDSPGLSAKTLRRIVNEKDPRQARPHELREIARACDVPFEFFTEPLPAATAPAADDDEDDLSTRLDRIEEIALQNQQLLLALASDAGITEQPAAARALREVEAWRKRKAAEDQRASRRAPAKRRRATG